VARFFALVFAALMASACSNQPKVVPAKLTLKSIALVPATNPQEFALTGASAAQFIVPLAATVQRIDGKQKTRAFTQQRQAKNLSMGSSLTEATAKALRAQGFEVQVLEQVERLKDSPDNVDHSKPVLAMHHLTL
jgi:energy-coupling factor transporter transmembrane protein EcfT